MVVAGPHPDYGRGCAKSPLVKMLEITTVSSTGLLIKWFLIKKTCSWCPGRANPACTLILEGQKPYFVLAWRVHIQFSPMASHLISSKYL